MSDLCFKNMTVRFFIYDYDLDPVGLREVSENEFSETDGLISYERHTVFENGVSQICLTKRG